MDFWDLIWDGAVLVTGMVVGLAILIFVGIFLWLIWDHLRKGG